MSLLLREANEKDLGYLINSWMHMGRNQNSNCKIPLKDYDDYYKMHIVRLLANKDSVFVRILVDTENENDICGFVVYSFTTLNILAIHQIYIRQQSSAHPGFGNIGMASFIIRNIYALDKPIIALNENRVVKQLIRKFPTLLTYNPYVVLK